MTYKGVNLINWTASALNTRPRLIKLTTFYQTGHGRAQLAVQDCRIYNQKISLSFACSISQLIATVLEYAINLLVLTEVKGSVKLFHTFITLVMYSAQLMFLPVKDTFNQWLHRSSVDIFIGTGMVKYLIEMKNVLKKIHHSCYEYEVYKIQMEEINSRPV